MNGLSIVGLLVGVGLVSCARQEPPVEAADSTRQVQVFGVDSITKTPPLAEVLQQPVMTPFTVAPEVLNRDEVLRARDRESPPHLMAAGVSGTARIWFLIDDQGRILSRVIHEGSGNAELDAAALRVAQVFRFSSALNRDQPVYVWVSIPIQFGSG